MNSALERWLLIVAGAALVLTVIFAPWGLALIRKARMQAKTPVEQKTVAPYDEELAIVASWDDFTSE